MQFFVPGAATSEVAERVWDATRKFAVDNVGETTERRIYAIDFRHHGERHRAEVGKPDPYEGQTVLCILQRDDGLNFVCTLERGVQRGMPILVGKEEVIAIEDFETLH